MPPFPFMLCKGCHLRQCLNMQQCPSLHEFADAGWGIVALGGLHRVRFVGA